MRLAVLIDGENVSMPMADTIFAASSGEVRVRRVYGRLRGRPWRSIQRLARAGWTRRARSWARITRMSRLRSARWTCSGDAEIAGFWIVSSDGDFAPRWRIRREGRQAFGYRARRSRHALPRGLHGVPCPRTIDCGATCMPRRDSRGRHSRTGTVHDPSGTRNARRGRMVSCSSPRIAGPQGRLTQRAHGLTSFACDAGDRPVLLHEGTQRFQPGHALRGRGSVDHHASDRLAGVHQVEAAVDVLQRQQCG